jgi:V-type H+-transporting ATPase subunit G
MNQLKVAEKEASSIVAEARAYRVDKMKDAKTGAEAAIASYRNEVETEFVRSTSGAGDASGADLLQNADKDIKDMNRDFDSGKAKVQDILVSLVCKSSV